jgi:hypothetical protein
MMQDDLAPVTRETTREHSHEDGRSKRRRRANGLCTCGNEPNLPGQAYGAKCHAAYNRRWRAKQKRELKELRAAAAELARLHAQQEQGQGRGD